ncbi:MAG: tetraacyldisaccharide 4'-kinase [Legionella sp.]|nr:tetraacyldisaccharide 4'-kinase [Legionella sp.]
MMKLLDALWYKKHPLYRLLIPFSLLYMLISRSRRWVLSRFFQQKWSVPVVVVGNISLGGVGKTPFVIALAEQAKARGLRVGIVSRGYSAQRKQFPYEVHYEDDARLVGDEPLLIAHRTQCPVIIDPNRRAAVDYLIKKYNCQMIISDDGLQHYRMGRAIEIAIIDGTRGLGNSWCIPAGPLRESEERLQEVDFVVVNTGYWHKAYSMHLQPDKIKSLYNNQEVIPSLRNLTWHAIAAIGNPQRFYSTLDELGLKYNFRSYPDHYVFKAEDVENKSSPIIMTEKDAVKCRLFSSNNMYYLPVNAVLEDGFWDAFWSHKQLKGFLT